MNRTYCNIRTGHFGTYTMETYVAGKQTRQTAIEDYMAGKQKCLTAIIWVLSLLTMED